MAEFEIKTVRQGLDMDHRDPENINQHARVMFESAFAEPEGSHSINGVWSCSFATFWAMKNCCYYALSTLCAGPCAFYWGLIFACQSFYNIWCCRPCLTCFFVDFHCCYQYYARCIECCLGPCYDASARMFSKIKFNHRYEVV